MGTPSSNMVWDYIVFAVFILGCSMIAIYSKFAGPKERTKADYVFATGRVSMAAMMLSIARGTLGVRSFLGYPSELYYRGSAMWETLYGMICAYPIVIFIFVPVYYSLGITSVYQYLDLRFKSRLVRCIASFTYVIRSLLNLGVTVFTPCVALKTVIGLPYWASILSITVISIIFTIMGGLKAAITADVVQGLTMITCSLAIIIQGCIQNGGFGEIINVSSERQRLQFFNFDLDPTIRVTTLSALFGQLFMSLSIFGCQQNFVQRYCSMDSQRAVTKTMMANIPVITVLFSLSWVTGMVIFASYADCDPLSLGYISKIDEILPFYVEDKFVFLPGLLGLFMASLFNGALSLSVSNLNSLATVTWEDFVSQLPQFRDVTDRRQLLLIKIIGSLYGLAIMGISFGVATLSGVIESSMLMTSATSGPLLGVFLLAMLFPCVNWKGAASGMIISHIVTLWITFGGLTIDKPPIQLLPLSTAGCTNDSYSHVISPGEIPVPYSQSRFEWANHSNSEQSLYNYRIFNNISTDMEKVVPINRGPEDVLTQLYSITYMYYSLIGCGITVFMGIIISYIAGTSPEDAYDEKLIHPLALKISTLFPGRPRRYVQDKITSPDKFGSNNSEILQTRAEQKPCDFSKEPTYRATEFTTACEKSPI
ncbi:sodium-coupled monocarboxylate transporter 2 [Periplaneta americana]|uniref:sodium-coupled monocarboxylate transporter 2 n=1 Tax=Periplaneta americana TaxID=6978 RepID=UPI0037E7914B